MKRSRLLRVRFSGRSWLGLLVPASVPPTVSTSVGVVATSAVSSSSVTSSTSSVGVGVAVVRVAVVGVAVVGVTVTV